MNPATKIALSMLVVQFFSNCCCTPEVFAQAHQAGARKRKQRLEHDPNPHVNIIKEPPQMPGISFPGGKFLYGFKNQTQTGTAMGARFLVADQSSSVIAYYRSVLEKSGWKIASKASYDNKVYASNQQYRSTVSITTFPSRKGGCEVYFTYGMH